MGFNKQPKLWLCGPYALKHALITLGVFAHEREIARVAGTTWVSGTDETQMRRAAAHYKCDLPMIRRHDRTRARQALASYLRRGIPVLLSVDEWAHWIVVVKQEKGRFIALDSEDDAVLTVLTAAQLDRRWVYHEPDEHDEEAVFTLYDLHPVVPRFRVTSRARFSIRRARHLRRPENRALSRLWVDYARDLLEICRVRTPLSENVISMGEFLRRHETLIVEQVAHWHGGVEPRSIKKILGNLHFVADTLGVVIHNETETRAIAAITTLLTLWAAGNYGAAPVY